MGKDLDVEPYINTDHRCEYRQLHTSKSTSSGMVGSMDSFPVLRLTLVPPDVADLGVLVRFAVAGWPSPSFTLNHTSYSD